MRQSNNGEKVLLFGGLPQAYLDTWDITSDLDLIKERLGVTFDTVPHAVLEDRYINANPAERALTARLIADLLADVDTRVTSPMPPLSGIEKAVRLYVVMETMREAHAGDALSIVCKPWIEEPGAPVPCTALMLFQENGTPAACQGDLDALLTMMLYRRIGVHPTFMGGARAQNHHVNISHCALARTIAGDRPQPYEIRDYHGRKASPTIWTNLPAGETVTIARLTKDLRSLLLTTGTVRAEQETTASCTNALVIDVNDHNRIVNAVKGVQNHYVIAWGDHSFELATEARSHGIPIVYL
jgi:L-fucose isomerase-like protein